MNSDQVTGIIRTIIMAVTAWAMGKGYIDNQTAAAIVTIAVTLGVAVWSWYTNTEKAKIQSVNAAPNGVTVVSTKQAEEAGIPPATAPITPAPAKP